MFLAISDIKFMIAGMLAMLLLFASFLIAFMISQRKKLKYQQEVQHLRETQQNQLIEAAVRSEEIERHRIAEVLHDEIGAILSSSKLHIQGIKLTNLDDRDNELLAKGKELLDDGIKKVRGISHNLHSNILKEFGLNDAIRHFINQTVEGTLIKSSIDLDDSYTTYNAEKDISIYRMIQEIINNILKHSNADQLTIRSVYKKDNLTFSIFHTGTGITQKQFERLRYKKEGLGLKNIMNRIILLKGKIKFSSDSSGYYVEINSPINSPLV